MKPNFLFIPLALSIIIYSSAYSQDDNTNDRSMDFSIGGSNYINFTDKIVQSFYNQIDEYTDIYYKRNPVERYTDKWDHGVETIFNFFNFGPSVSVGLNASLTYNISKKTSVGFLFDLSYSFYYNAPSSGYNKTTNAIIFRNMLRIKSGIPQKNEKFLFETGFVLGLDKNLPIINKNPNKSTTRTNEYKNEFFDTDDHEYIVTHTYYYYNPDIILEFGPAFSWGMSSIVKSFCVEFGGYIDFLYGCTLYIPESPADYNRSNFIFDAGFFFRFDYNKNFKLDGVKK